MIGKCLGLDINSEYVAAVLLKRGFHSVELLACAAEPLEGDDHASLDRALKSILSGMDTNGAICLCSLPIRHASFRHLKMPFADTKKISQTAAFEMEPLVPFSIDEALVDFTVAARAEEATTILAAAVNRRFLEETISRLRNFQLNPFIIDIHCVPLALHLMKKAGAAANFLLLDRSDRCVSMILCLQRRIGLVRSIALPVDEGGNSTSGGQKILAREVLNTLRAFNAQAGSAPLERIYLSGPLFSRGDDSSMIEGGTGIPAEVLDLGREVLTGPGDSASRRWDPGVMNNALALAIRETKRWRGFNYRMDEFKVNRPLLHYRREIKKAALLVLALLCFFAADFTLEYFSLKNRFLEVDRMLVGSFRQDFPEVERIIDPIAQLRGKMKEIEGPAGAVPVIASRAKALDVLMEISRWIDPDVNIEVNRMIIDQETVQVVGETDNFNTVNNIENMLEKSPSFQDVTISSANLDKTGNEVQFEIRIARKK